MLLNGFKIGLDKEIIPEIIPFVLIYQGQNSIFVWVKMRYVCKENDLKT